MFKKTLLASLVSAALLSGCGGDSSSNNDDTSPTSLADNFPAEGVALPYTVLRSDLIDANTQQPFEVRNGGYGSAMTGDPASKRRFYALTDRGPNANFTGNYGKGKKFPTPEYTPRIGHYEVTSEGKVVLLDTILLKRPDGSLITGLPNNSALGGTGETPYNADGSPVLEDPTQPYDAETNPLRLDDYGLDGEGMVALSDGTFWVSDEYGPHIVHFDAEGKEIGRINPFAGDQRNDYTLPAEFANRRANRGMEGLAITPDEKTLVGIMQSTMDNPTKDVRNLDMTRIVTINLDDGSVGQYLYKQEKNQNSNSELAALSATQFLVLERDGSFLYGGPDGAGAANPSAQKTVYRIDLSTGTNLETLATGGDLSQDPDLGLTIAGSTLEEVVQTDGWSGLAAHNIVPVEKHLVVDMVAQLSYPHDKMEGLWVIDSKTLGVLNDDDFATWSTSSGELEQKMLDSNTIDRNRLYIVPADLAVK
ncbi:MAG: esterase-like activity of phytase family protein [Alcanivorax sp.]|uniref:esterase-like activity of phytase family protein n=1 Tax=Alloalcanivorax marinus TaxID=1177169 RepID=UPI00195B711E|nr:esterase-like activity of phytase family protein [Alloalcanivorax marinus]MBM7334344.1 esterase-like activity of phytase family protein [Alloalcanivorax marinus]